MKSKMFTKSKRNIVPSGNISMKWAKQFRSRIERHYTKLKLKNFVKDKTEVEDFDILPQSQYKPGFWGWVID